MFKSGLLFVFCIAVTGCVHHHPHSHPHTHPELEPVVVENTDTGDGTVVHLPVVTNEPVVYCRQCGVMPGKVSNCPSYSSHNFTSAQAGSKVVCGQCGVYPTTAPTSCPSYSSHNFMTARPDAKLVCRQCGSAPTGKPLSCPSYSRHNFKEFK